MVQSADLSARHKERTTHMRSALWHPCHDGKKKPRREPGLRLGSFVSC